PNGPSTLLQILSGRAQAPSEVAGRHPVPLEVDAVIEDALAKDPALRTPSVGAFVDAFGHAYGLSGRHAEWAQASERQLAERMALDGAREPAVVPSTLAPGQAGAPLGTLATDSPAL